MVAPLTDTPTPGVPAPPPAAPPRNDDALISRLNMIASRIDGLADDNHEARQRMDRLETRISDNAMRQSDQLMNLERGFEDKIGNRVNETVRDAVRGVIGVELSVIRPPIEAQAARLAAVESRLERVETIQVESMNVLDVRFSDLGFQTRLALSAGGLVTLATIMVVLLR